jgi:hypothetical protein
MSLLILIGIGERVSGQVIMRRLDRTGEFGATAAGSTIMSCERELATRFGQ